MRGTLVAVALAVALALVALEARALLAARAELERAGVATSEVERLTHLRRAARWRAPLSPYPERALTRLRSLALATKSRDVELRAWEGIRGALLGSRVFAVSSPEGLREANERIAALRAGATSGEEYRRLLSGLARNRGPSPWWSLVALTGLCCWIVGGGCFGRRLRLRVGFVLGGMALFLVGLALA